MEAITFSYDSPNFGKKSQLTIQGLPSSSRLTDPLRDQLLETLQSDAFDELCTKVIAARTGEDLDPTSAFLDRVEGVVEGLTQTPQGLSFSIRVTECEGFNIVGDAADDLLTVKVDPKTAIM